MEKKRKRGERLPTLKMRAFVEFLAKGGMTKRDCYIAAGYKPCSNPVFTSAKAYELSMHPWVREELRKVMEEASKKTVLTIAKVLDNYNKVYEAALKDGDYAAATRAMELYGKHLGMFIERSESGKPGAFSGKSLEDVNREIKALAAAQGLVLSEGTETKQ
jgi:hypothetical protein